MFGLRTLRRSAGAQVVVEARDGATALQQITRLRPQLACLDIEMPGLDGLEVPAQLRAARSQVLMISSATSGENVRQALAADADGCIAKPFSASKISQQIELALVRRRTAKQQGAGALHERQPASLRSARVFTVSVRRRATPSCSSSARQCAAGIGRLK